MKYRIKSYIPPIYIYRSVTNLFSIEFTSLLIFAFFQRVYKKEYEKRAKAVPVLRVAQKF